jgi:hypothetical protein
MMTPEKRAQLEELTDAAEKEAIEKGIDLDKYYEEAGLEAECLRFSTFEKSPGSSNVLK